MKYHHSLPIRMAIIEKIITIAGEVVEKLEPSHAGENFCKPAAATLEKSLAVPQTVKQSYYMT